MLAPQRSTAFSSARVCNVVAALLVALHWVMAVSAVATKSPTFDEPTHIAAGYSYWLRNDYRLDPEAGVLPLRIAALPLLFSRPNFVAPDAPSWLKRDQGKVGTEFLYEVGNEADTLLLRGRMMMAVVSAALCGVIYCWSRSLFGPRGGLISVAVAAFCPTLLGHGALVTADVTAALFFALSAWTTWRMLEQLSVLRVFLTGCCIGGLLLSKMSGALVAAIVIGMLVAQFCFRPSELLKARHLGKLAVAVAAAALVSVGLIWCAYGFRYSAVNHGDESLLAGNWSLLLQTDGIIPRVISFARADRLLPEAYLYGFAYTHHSAQARPAFLDGNWSMIGFLDFFPRAFFYKTPLGIFALIILSTASVVLIARGKLRPQTINTSRVTDMLYHTIPVWLLVIVYGAFALTARLNIGHRHILPVYVAIYVLLGASAVYLRRGMPITVRIAVGGMVAMTMVESLAARPNYIAYFNPIAGGSSNGYTHLVDSSLDWGQDLPGLSDWLTSNNQTEHRPTYLAYFGTGRPEYYGINAVRLPLAAGVSSVALQGGTYCISATTLEQVYSRAMGNWAAPYEQLYQNLRRLEGVTSPSTLRELEFARMCAALRHRTPVATIGYSILVYQLSDDQVRQAIAGPPPELSPTVEIAGIN